MFVSKLLNKLFFNTNNDCYFTTLLGLNKFMLSKDNYKKILDTEPETNTLSSGNGAQEGGVYDISNEATSSFGDDELLRRKSKFRINVSNETSQNSPGNEESRYISPIPFDLSEPVTPENLFHPIETPALVEEKSSAPSLQIVETAFSGQYSPKQQDTLFWCIFIIANGYGEYMNIDRNYGIRELEIKKQIGSFVETKGYQRSSPNYKITNSLRQEIHSELLTSQKDTSFPCLSILCCYYKINVVLLHPSGRMMLEFLSQIQEDAPFYILKKDNYGKYSVDTDKKTWKDIQELKSRFICIDNYMKPMKAAGNYKMEDLEMLAYKLGVLDETKKYKKNELYQLVQQHLNWFGGREPTVP